MAEVTIRIIDNDNDNDNDNVSLIMEAIPPLQGSDKDLFTEAQQLGVAFMERIVKQGVNNFIKSTDDE